MGTAYGNVYMYLEKRTFVCEWKYASIEGARTRISVPVYCSNAGLVVFTRRLLKSSVHQRYSLPDFHLIKLFSISIIQVTIENCTLDVIQSRGSYPLNNAYTDYGITHSIMHTLIMELRIQQRVH